MRVLMITGDKNIFVPGTSAYERFLLQKSVVEELTPVYWGKGAIFAPFFVKGNYNVVTVQDPFFRGFVGWIISGLKKARFNVQVHTDFEAQTSESLLRHILGQIVLRHADSVRVVSEKIKKQIEKHTKSSISVLPVFIDIEKIRVAVPADLQREYPHFKKIILVAARLEPEKNIGLAIDSMPSILKEIPETGMLIAGSGSEEEKLKQKAKNLSIENRVIFLGFRNDIASLYKAADVLLVTSNYESYGAGIVEALAAGLPVVSPDVGIAREAGALVASSQDLPYVVARVLKENVRGQLKLSILSRDVWREAWKNTL